MATPVGQWSFAKGELAPSLYARVDLAAYKVGAALLRNFFVDYRGGATSRPGFQFLARARASEAVPGVAGQPRLIRFIFSTIQAYNLEFGHGYMRVHMNGANGPGPVLEPAFSVTAAPAGSPAQITVPGHDFSVYDAVYVAGLVGMTTLNGATCLGSALAGSVLTLTTLDGVAITTSGAYVSGGTVARVYTLATPYAAADLPLLKVTQSAQVMTICHQNYPPQNLTRTQHYAWTLTPVSFSASVLPPINLAASQGGTTSTTGWYYAYVVTAETDISPEESNASAVVQANNVTQLNQDTGVQNSITWYPPASGNPPARYNVYKAPPNYGSAVPAGAVFGLIGQTTGNSFTDLNLGPDYSTTPPLHRDPFANAAIATATVASSGSGYVAPTATVVDSTGSGAVIQLAQIGGQLAGALVVNAGQGYTAPTVTISDSAGSGGNVTLALGPATGNYPGVAEYYQERLVFAATANAPESLWATQTGAYNNMDQSVPSVDDDALTLTLTSKQLNAIKHLLAMPAGLVAFTAAGAWLIGGGGVGASVQPLTPTNDNAQPQASNGAADVPPLPIGHDVLFVDARGSYVRDFTWNLYVNIYSGTDLSWPANHLFDGHSIAEWCYAEAPNKIAWAVREDGLLLSETYLKEQDVSAWAHHDTQGFFRSVASIPEGNEDVVYAVVERYLNGQWVYLVERMHSRLLGGDYTRGIVGDCRLAWCVDAGLSYPLTYPVAALTLSGLTATTQSKGPPTYSGNFSAATSAPVTVYAGDCIEINGGVGTVTAGCVGGMSFSGTINSAQPMLNLLPATAGNWSCTTPVQTIGGLTHLNNMAVAVLADGSVVSGLTVTKGTITLPVAATRIVVGLGFTAQLQTLAIEAGEPTLQGRRKKLAAVTLRVQDTRGLWVGHDFTTMWPIKEATGAYMNPLPLITGDERIALDPRWELLGQIAVQQSYPLPARILGVIPEIEAGDTPG